MRQPYTSRLAEARRFPTWAHAWDAIDAHLEAAPDARITLAASLADHGRAHVACVWDADDRSPTPRRWLR